MSTTFSAQGAMQEYKYIHQFTQEYNKINYLQLDNYTTQKVNLFALPERQSFLILEDITDKIIAALPAIKRILSKPITRLKDVVSILPVEAVRVINNATMGHIALHTELWGDITKEGLKPRKLKTLSHEDDYKIYENLALVKLVDAILLFVKRNARILKDVIYSTQTISFNLLERTNHLMHFLAIGKLHVGYAHTQDRYHNAHQKCLDKLIFIDKVLRSKLNAPVYKICKKDNSKLTLKKTNVFRLQKDYKQVYALLKLFAEKDNLQERPSNFELVPEDGYADYCTLLSLFSAGHFNFTFDEKDKFNFTNLSTECTFSEWKLKIERLSVGELSGLRFTANKNQPYSICLLFYNNEKISDCALSAFKEKYSANEYLFAHPFEFGNVDLLHLNIFDISSFRRLQQLIFRAMIYSDTARDICPFCGNKLTKTEQGYECSLCRTFIVNNVCPETGKEYFTTTLKDYKLPSLANNNSVKPFVDKTHESALFFRNVTPLSSKGKLLCPHCGKAHN